ncbi:CAP domain-containing protein [Albibacterium bauzanense]|uniref:Uncharacterized protein YkwD n=1 Tax=Albibacterium bauzanense TaxID=653929 RepID=A0A4R1LP62_9SPHI|nr:CvpA family protein [Albibacterium bauzanense]TCK80605.1 uncharacterized protein YkwD [Albibacterium bauzanense]
MNFISIILIIILLLSTVNGITRGFILSFTSLLSWLGSLLLMIFLYPYVVDFLKRIMEDNLWIMPFAVFISLIVTGLFMSLLFNQFLRFIPIKAHDNLVNKIAGVFPGAITGLLYAALLSLLLLILPLSERISNETRNSKIVQQLTLGLDKVENRLKPGFKETISQTMQMTTIEEGSKETLKLPFSVKFPKVREPLEKEMLNMINVERKAHGLAPLEVDSRLTNVARDHSRDMFTRSYFSHISPEGLSPFDRIRKANILFLTAGENLALAQTIPIAHEGLMNSPGHRANILNPSFRRVGIGVLDGGIYGLMITQEFKN